MPADEVDKGGLRVQVEGRGDEFGVHGVHEVDEPGAADHAGGGKPQELRTWEERTVEAGLRPALFDVRCPPATPHGGLGAPATPSGKRGPRGPGAPAFLHDALSGHGASMPLISYPPPVPHRARCRRAPLLAAGPFDVRGCQLDAQPELSSGKEDDPDAAGRAGGMGAPWVGTAQWPPFGGSPRVPRRLSVSACSSCSCARRSMPSLSCSISSISVAVGRAGGELSSVRRS